MAGSGTLAAKTVRRAPVGGGIVDHCYEPNGQNWRVVNMPGVLPRPRPLLRAPRVALALPAKARIRGAKS